VNAFEDAPSNLRRQRLDVDHNVWKFRHRPAFYRAGRRLMVRALDMHG
jgi:hypothetical protein